MIEWLIFRFEEAKIIAIPYNSSLGIVDGVSIQRCEIKRKLKKWILECCLEVIAERAVAKGRCLYAYENADKDDKYVH